MLQQLPNPTQLPLAVTEGYQRQNTNMYAIQTGLDTTEPYDNGSGTITIPMGGIVEVNGVLFKVFQNVLLTKTNNNTAYWIEIITNDDGTANFALVTRPGVWNPDKQGCYRTNNRRTLNWVSRGIPSSLNNANERVLNKTTKGIENLYLQKSWYYVDLRSGSGSGDGESGSGGIGGAGGVASVYNSINYIFFNNDNLLRHNVKVGGSGFNGGNGGNGGTAVIPANGAPGSSGSPGGGGGSGGGEESTFDNITTGYVLSGSGDGGNNAGRNGSSGSSGSAGSNYAGGGNGGFAGNGGSGGNGYGFLSGGGGRGGNGGNGGNGAGGSGAPSVNGGNGGVGGSGGVGGQYGGMRPVDNSAAGYCNIYRLQN
jgi:hypothetical protein